MGANFGTFIQTAGVQYVFAEGVAQTIGIAGIIQSPPINFSDFGGAGQPDFSVIGPPSQCWYIDYAVLFTLVGLPPVDPLGFQLQVSSSFDRVAPFAFFTSQQILLPTYAAGNEFYQGSFRMGASAGRIALINSTGVAREVSFVFWGRSF